jgi:hypothetical protein
MITLLLSCFKPTHRHPYIGVGRHDGVWGCGWSANRRRRGGQGAAKFLIEVLGLLGKSASIYFSNL